MLKKVDALAPKSLTNCCLLQTGCEVKTKYHCAGALTLEVDTSDIFALRKAAQLHMKEGVGLKCQAILWLFSHLEGYNNAEALYQGAPELLTWQYDPVAVVRILNLEHARLQRLQKTIDAHSISEDKDSYQAICLLVGQHCGGNKTALMPSVSVSFVLRYCLSRR